MAIKTCPLTKVSKTDPVAHKRHEQLDEVVSRLLHRPDLIHATEVRLRAVDEVDAEAPLEVRCLEITQEQWPENPQVFGATPKRWLWQVLMDADPSGRLMPAFIPEAELKNKTTFREIAEFVCSNLSPKTRCC